MTYAVNEIFYSLQGEGVRAGTPNVFVRFQGCNLTCTVGGEAGFDCDTEFESGKKMERGELVEEMGSLWGPNALRACVLTGGEPMLQADNALIQALNAERWYIAIETNGTRVVPSTLVDWVCISPKSAPHTIKVRDCDEFKLVRHYGQELPASIPCDAKYKLVSPAFEAGQVSRETLEWCVDLVKRNPEWRLSCQQHKWWDVR